MGQMQRRNDILIEFLKKNVISGVGDICEKDTRMCAKVLERGTFHSAGNGQ